MQRILNYLVAHPEKHPPFGDSGRWRDSYVLQILSNRAAFGEFQPQMREEGNRRVDCGEPIKNYFPPVISEELFFQVQAGMKARFRVTGQAGRVRDEPVHRDRLPRRGPDHDVGPHVPPGDHSRRRDEGPTATSRRGRRPTARRGGGKGCRSRTRRSSRPCCRRCPN